MKRFVVSSGWAILGLAALAAASAGGARAGGSGPHAVGIPGIGPGTGVDVYIPNPDPQTPIAWSQGTEPPPPQGDYGGGALQYMITGNESRPVPTPRVAPPYFPARAAPVRGFDGRTELSTHQRPMQERGEGAAYGGGSAGGGHAPRLRSAYPRLGYGGPVPVAPPPGALRRFRLRGGGLGRRCAPRLRTARPR